ncbi:hypothetical protein MBLNU13_g02699t2 [Cladosporium sp. NU13]
MGTTTETEVSLTNVHKSSTPSSTEKHSLGRSRPPRDLIYVEGEHNDPGPVGPAYATLWKRRNHGFSLDDIATQPSVFDDERLAALHQPHPKYENLHRFDPDERWTWREELPIIRKLDWRVTAWAAIAFFALDLPRGNISQANTDNFLDDLGLDTNDFNTGQTLFRVAFLFAELPSQLVSKKIGPDVWIPAQMIMWSLVSGGQFWLSGKASFFTCRVLIGLLQGGFIPDLILYMSYFFKGTELPFRLATFWMANRLTDVIAPLLAFGLLRLRGVHEIMVNRILRDDPSKSDMHNRQGITLDLMWKAMKDYDMWPIYLLGLTFGIPAGPPDQYLTLTLRRLDFDTFDSNLLSIPAQVLTTINMMIMTYISEKVNQRAYMGIFSQIWLLPCLIALLLLPISTSNPWTTYAILTTLLSYPTPHPIQVGWCSRISNSTRTRTVSAALYNMFVQVQSIISSNIYRQDDIPDYKKGNSALVAISVLNIVFYIAVKQYYMWRNKSKERKWQQLSAEEKANYLETTTAEGNKRLDFRFVH